MKKRCISKDWKFSSTELCRPFKNYVDVDLPHDYQIKQKRTANVGDWVTPHSGNSGNGYYPDTPGRYVKYLTFEENKNYILDIDGAYMMTYVTFNDNMVGKHPYGYTPYLVNLTPFILKGMNNKLAIETFPLEHSTRWYSGNGIYRDVFLWEGGKVRIEPWDMFISTNKIEGNDAEVRLRYWINSDKNTKAEVKFTVLYEGNEVLSKSLNLTVKKGKKEQFEHIITVNDAHLWDVDNPNLYTLKTDIYVKGELVDQSENTFGIRTISIGVNTGLLLNGKQIKLKGGCIHHDHGILGSAAYPDAEYRKVKRLKDAGLNALRCAHNPPSLAFLEVCDRLGMIVMDEAFDTWQFRKRPRDYNLFFEAWCERDISYMVQRERNHPCVFSYSIGNEITEINGQNGAEKYANLLTQYVKQHDETRPVTSGVQKWFATNPKSESIDPDDYRQYLKNKLNNKTYAEVNEICKEYEKPLDLIGINYNYENYHVDHEMYPNRVVWGSETFSIDAYDSWKEVMENDYVLGDFNWTAFDNMGEVGAGKSSWLRDGYVPGIRTFEYPWRTCYQGDLDMCMNRKPQSYFRQSIWEENAPIRIFTTHPEHFGEVFSGTHWHFYDVDESWTYDDKYVGRPIKAETYTSAEKVEWFVNGKKIGESVPEKNIASIETVYEKGYIEAVAYRGGEAYSSYRLETCDKASQINLSSELKTIKADNRNLCYVDITVADSKGRLCTDYEGEIECKVWGGELVGIHSANPCNEDDYTGNKCHVFKGRALAVIRTKKAGNLSITVYNNELAGATFNINAVDEE